jgi:cytochrome c oxidase assembly factor CtaG
MWWPIVSNVPELPRWSYPVQMVYLFLLSIAQIIVFAAITFAKEPLYEAYVNAPRVLGVDPLVDQQVGGIIMKIGSSLVFMPLVIIFFYRWFGQEEEKRKAEAVAREYFER